MGLSCHHCPPTESFFVLLTGFLLAVWQLMDNSTLVLSLVRRSDLGSQLKVLIFFGVV